MDCETTLAECKTRIQKFCEERDWDQYHNPKDLAIGIITEASELLEKFRFQNEHHSTEMLLDQNKREAVKQELADIFFFVLRFSQRFEIDLDTAIQSKLAINAEKYPVEKAHGSNLKYTELQ